VTKAELERLSGVEVLARLVQRGTPTAIARDYVEHRNDNDVQEAILRILRDKKGRP